METADERLAWAVRFAQMNLARLRPGDWLNLRDELKAFVHMTVDHGGARPGGLVTFAPDPADPRSGWSEADFRALQAEVRALLMQAAAVHEVAGALKPVLEALRAGRRLRVREGEPASKVTPITLKASYLLMPVLQRPGRCHLLARGTIRDMALLALVHLFGREETSRVRRCPECRTIFVRVRRQLYCSRRCVNKVNKRAWRIRREARRRHPGEPRQRRTRRKKGREAHR